MSRFRALAAAVLAASAVGLAGAAPASGQAGPSLTINPTSGPVSTIITATIANCTPPTTGGGLARLDFSFSGFTPSNTRFFTPDPDGTTTVTIKAMDKEGQTETRTDGEVTVSQCGNEGLDRKPFTVVRFGSRPAVIRGNTWYLRNTTSSGPAHSSFQYGDSTDFPLFGDWLGGGNDGPGVVRGNIWYLRNTPTTGAADTTFRYGNWDDFPVVGNWDGVGGDTPGVVRGNIWYLRNSNASGVAETSFRYGNGDDFPVVGDWDGDGDATPGVVRGNTWYLRNSNTGGVAEVILTFGNNTDFPIVGDWDQNGTDTPGIVRGNVWYLRNSNDSGVADISFRYGNWDDFPLVWGAVPG